MQAVKLNSYRLSVTAGIPVNSVLLRFVDLYKRDLAKEDNRRDTMALLEKLKTHEPVHRKSSTGDSCQRRTGRNGSYGSLL